MPWQAVDSRARGVKHLERGIPCQDYSAYKHLSEEHIIGAISDGMGSAKHSDLGSKVAVETAIFELSQVNWQLLEKGSNPYARTLFSSVLEAVRLEINNQANKNGYQVQDLACTLIVFSATPHRLIAMQVGDGLLVVRSEGGDYKLLFEPDKGEFANETTSVTSTNAQDEMKVDQTEPYIFICAATDGIENISLIKSENWKPSPKFFHPLEQHILSKDSSNQKKDKLEAFLNSDRINQNTDDDKTILLCAYKNSYPHMDQEEQIRGTFDNTNLNATLEEEEKLSKKVETVNNSFSLKKDLVCYSQQEKLSKQELKLIKLRIIDALHQLNCHSLPPKVGQSEKTGYLRVWLPSNKKLPNKRRIASVIRQIVIDLNEPYIKRVEVFNCLPEVVSTGSTSKKVKNLIGKSSFSTEESTILQSSNSNVYPSRTLLKPSQKIHWVEKFYLKKTSNLVREILLIVIILCLILAILLYKPSCYIFYPLHNLRICLGIR